MVRRTSAWYSFRQLPTFSERWIDRLWLLALFVAALILFCFNLGELPLRDWDEGIVAQVARDIWRAPAGSQAWLYPTIAGEPYLNKPPLLHWLIALSYRLGGVSEWTTRLPGAVLSALAVPSLYAISRELTCRRMPAIFGALVYLTLLPVMRHGRLAMLDGALVCFFLLLLMCLLRARRNLRWALGVGFAFGLLCLTKGLAAVLLGAIAVGFLLWDTPRLLTSRYLWWGVALGSLPVLGWYGAQWLHYGQAFLDLGLLQQALSRVWRPVENHTGPPWYYLLEVMKYSLPWLLFLPWGLRRVWENRNMGWAKLLLVWLGGYLLVISLMSTKLPWYVMPLYPALALVVGMELAEIWQPEDAMGVRQPRPRYPIAWTGSIGLLAVLGWLGCLYFSAIGLEPNAELQILAAAIGLTMSITTFLLVRRDSQFILVLLWGMYVSLLLLTMSHYWLWELYEDYPVKPVAAIVQQGTPIGQTVLTSHPVHRPSLNFYSDRQVVPAAADSEGVLLALQQHWQQDDQPYLLLDRQTFSLLKLEQVQRLGESDGWSLVRRDRSRWLPKDPAPDSEQPGPPMDGVIDAHLHPVPTEFHSCGGMG